jgi:hypothetical protein
MATKNAPKDSKNKRGYRFEYTVHARIKTTHKLDTKDSVVLCIGHDHGKAFKHRQTKPDISVFKE